MKHSDYDPNDFAGDDAGCINEAIRAAAAAGGTARIGRRRPDGAANRDYWLIDSAILLPGGANVVFENCRVKRSDRCRDNFLRSANCIPGAAEVRPLSGIRVRGEGRVIFEGADRPRATGDAATTLYTAASGVEGGYVGGLQDGVWRSYGTDAGVAGECQTGDWRNIGVLFAHVSDFSLAGLTFVNTHGWAVLLEHCSSGQVRSLAFDSSGYLMVDKHRGRILTQDGLDIRHGCHDIVVDTLTGTTGDDVLALTALPSPPRACGLEGWTEFCGGCADPRNDRSDDIFNIVVRNVVASSDPDAHTVRLLNNGRIRLHHVIHVVPARLALGLDELAQALDGGRGGDGAGAVLARPERGDGLLDVERDGRQQMNGVD